MPDLSSETGEFEYFFELYARIDELKIAYESANECIELIRDARALLNKAINEAPSILGYRAPDVVGVEITATRARIQPDFERNPCNI